MSISRCLDLSRIRDFLHINPKTEDQHIYFFTEAENLLKIYVLSGGRLWTTSLALSYLTNLASRLNVRNAQLLLVWLRESFTQNQFIAKVDNDSKKLCLTIGLSVPMQTILELTAASDTDLATSKHVFELVLALGQALLRSHAQVETLEKTNADKDPVLSSHGSILPSPQKRRTLGMSSTNPQNRKRKPAKGLVFDGDDDDDNVE